MFFFQFGHTFEKDFGPHIKRRKLSRLKNWLLFIDSNPTDSPKPFEESNRNFLRCTV